MKPYIDFVLNCPEYEIGLGAPRQTMRLVSVEGEERLLQHETKRDLTEKMQKYVHELIPKYKDCDGFILKSKSPTSSIENIPLYKKLEGPERVGKTKGLFGREILKNYGERPIIEETRLRNPVLFEYFLTKIYLWASFRHATEEFTQNALIQFQTHNKLLLMAFSQHLMRELGKIVGNQDGLEIDTVYDRYRMTFSELMQERLTYKNNINVLEHALGYFKDTVTKDERKFFLKEIDAYRAGTIPLSVPIHIMRDWIIRHDVKYLEGQTFFWPYPDEIIAHSQFYSNKERRERRSIIGKR